MQAAAEAAEGKGDALRAAVRVVGTTCVDRRNAISSWPAIKGPSLGQACLGSGRRKYNRNAGCGGQSGDLSLASTRSTHIVAHAHCHVGEAQNPEAPRHMPVPQCLFQAQTAGGCRGATGPTGTGAARGSAAAGGPCQRDGRHGGPVAARVQLQDLQRNAGATG